MRCLDRLGREHRDPGRGQPRALDRPRRQRDRAVAAALVDELHLPHRSGPGRPFRLQRHRDDGRQPRPISCSTARARSPSAAVPAGPAAPTSATVISSPVRTSRCSVATPGSSERSWPSRRGSFPIAPVRRCGRWARSSRPGPGAALENDYVQTALIADLPFPVDRGRAGCDRASGVGAPALARLQRGTPRPRSTAVTPRRSAVPRPRPRTRVARSWDTTSAPPSASRRPRAAAPPSPRRCARPSRPAGAARPASSRPAALSS